VLIDHRKAEKSYVCETKEDSLQVMGDRGLRRALPGLQVFDAQGVQYSAQGESYASFLSCLLYFCLAFMFILDFFFVRSLYFSFPLFVSWSCFILDLLYFISLFFSSICDSSLLKSSGTFMDHSGMSRPTTLADTQSQIRYVAYSLFLCPFTR
jgi:hypothetical protein